MIVNKKTVFNKKYDFLIVGSGLFGSTCAFELAKKGYKVLVVDRRNHVGGNIYTNKIEGINVHVYGAHIFHTHDPNIWSYINQFAEFNDFINSPLANFEGKLFHLPFNMNTFCEIWPDVKNADDAKQHISEEIRKCGVKKPSNLQETAINMVGKTIFETLIKGYTEKQWGRKCEELPSSIIKRIPLRFEFNNNYFNDPYQGIPIGGYTNIIEKMLRKSDVLLNCDYILEKEKLSLLAYKTIYTGRIDELFGCCFGGLEYRSLKFEIQKLQIDNFQNNAVVNYTSIKVPYTRIIEHKHFESAKSDVTIVTKEYPSVFDGTNEPYYTINNEQNILLYNKYLEKSKSIPNFYIGGRLGMYKYFDMDDCIIEALKLVKKISL